VDGHLSTLQYIVFACYWERGEHYASVLFIHSFIHSFFFSDAGEVGGVLPELVEFQEL